MQSQPTLQRSQSMQQGTYSNIPGQVRLGGYYQQNVNSAMTPNNRSPSVSTPNGFNQACPTLGGSSYSGNQRPGVPSGPPHTTQKTINNFPVPVQGYGYVNQGAKVSLLRSASLSNPTPTTPQHVPMKNQTPPKIGNKLQAPLAVQVQLNQDIKAENIRLEKLKESILKQRSIPKTQNPSFQIPGLDKAKASQMHYIAEQLKQLSSLANHQNPSSVTTPNKQNMTTSLSSPQEANIQGSMTPVQAVQYLSEQTLQAKVLSQQVNTKAITSQSQNNPTIAQPPPPPPPQNKLNQTPAKPIPAPRPTLMKEIEGFDKTKQLKKIPKKGESKSTSSIADNALTTALQKRFNGYQGTDRDVDCGIDGDNEETKKEDWDEQE